MNLVKLLGLAKNAGRVALYGGLAGTAGSWVAFGVEDVISLITATTTLIGLIGEVAVKIITAKAKASGKIPLDAVI